MLMTDKYVMSLFHCVTIPTVVVSCDVCVFFLKLHKTWCSLGGWHLRVSLHADRIRLIFNTFPTLSCIYLVIIKTTCHLEQKGTTLIPLILFGINYISHYPQMDKTVISSCSCLGRGNIEDPQTWTIQMNLDLLTQRTTGWMDTVPAESEWLWEGEGEREREWESYPYGGGGGLNSTEQVPGLPSPPCWFTCNHSNKHDSRAWKKELLHSVERAEASVGGCWGCCFNPACVHFYSRCSFSIIN